MPLIAEMDSVIAVRCALRRLTVLIAEAPARANALATEAPIPVLPPVMRIVFRAAEREGSVGGMWGNRLCARLACMSRTSRGFPLLMLGGPAI